MVSSHQTYQSQSQTLANSISKDLNNLNEFVQDHNRHCKSIIDTFNERNQFDLDLDQQQNLLGPSQFLKNMFNLNLLSADAEDEKETVATDELGEHSLPGHKGKFQITGMCLEEKSGFNSKKEDDNNNN